jgi:hypothetical protein
MQVDK